MKIIQVSPYDFAYPGGANNHLLNLDRELKRLGHETAIAAPSSNPSLSQLYPHLTILGRRPVPIPAGGSVARITISFRLSSRVKDLLERGRFDIVHLHEPLAPVLPWLFLRFSRSVNVGTFHAYQDWRRVPAQGYFYGRRILRRWFERLHGRIAVSPPALEFVRRYFPGEYRIIPNGIAYERFAGPVEPFPQYRDGRVNLLFVGRWEPRKGLKFLVRAFSLLRNRFDNIRLLVVGPDGGHRGAMMQTLARMGLAEDVVLIGYVRDEDLPRYYRSADIFCYPNTGLESFGLVLVEAMAAGLPIVASQVPGALYLLNNGIEGFLVPPKDPEALAAALSYLIEDAVLRQRMGRAGQRKAWHFRWESVAQQIVGYYEELLAEQAAPFDHASQGR